MKVNEQGECEEHMIIKTDIPSQNQILITSLFGLIYC